MKKFTFLLALLMTSQFAFAQTFTFYFDTDTTLQNNTVGQLVDFSGDECFIGLDLASKIDIAAKVYIFPKERNGQMHYYLFSKLYLPQATVYAAKNAAYQGWEIAGHIESTPGEAIDLDNIEMQVLDDADNFHVMEVAYDPFQATQMARHLDEEDLNLVEFRATVLNFSEPMKTLDALIRQKRIHHDGNPCMTWMMSNVVCHTDAKDNIYPRKLREEDKIDGPVAVIMALARAMFGEEEDDDYGEEGFTFI